MPGPGGDQSALRPPGQPLDRREDAGGGLAQPEVQRGDPTCEQGQGVERMNLKTTAIFLIFAFWGGVTFGQVTTRISVDSGGTESNGHTGDAAISADGRYEAFYSDATNLVS